MAESLLESLPTCLAVDVLGKWLCVQDRGRLDSAHCQSSTRKCFLDLIRSPELSVKTWVYDTRTSETTDDIVSWALNRCVLVEKLSIGSESNLDLYNYYLEKFAQGVLHVKLHKTQLSTFAKSIAQCSNLVALNFEDCEVSSSLRGVLTHCKSLRELRCNFNDYKYSDSAMKMRACTLQSADLEGLACPNIKVLFLKSSYDCAAVAVSVLELATEVEVLQISIGLNNPLIHPALSKLPTTVTTLSLPEMVRSPSVISIVAERLPHLQNLGLQNCEVTVETAQAIGSLFPHLKQLDLSNTEISDRALVMLANVCGARLTELHLCGCNTHTLSQHDVREQLPRFTKLTTFSKSFSEKNYGYFGVQLLERFTTLALCYDGDNAASFLNEVADHCAHLEHFQFQLVQYQPYRTKFCPSCIDTLILRCDQLRSITVDFALLSDLSAKINEGDAQRWQKLRPGLVVHRKFDAQLTALKSSA